MNNESGAWTTSLKNKLFKCQKRLVNRTTGNEHYKKRKRGARMQ